MSDDALDVAVIGGGIAGTSVASHLSDLGPSVSVFERGDLGGETTAKSAAFFGEYGTPLERRMKRYGMRVYNDLFREAEADLRYEHVGRLRVSTSATGADALREYAEDEGVRALEPDRVREVLLLPDLDPDAIEFATYRPHVGYFRPRPLARALAERARDPAVGDTSVRIETGTAVEGITTEDGRATGVELENEEVRADHVVCAAGPWTPRLARRTGYDVPVSHSLAPVLRVDADEPGYTLPIVTHHETGVYARGHEDGSALLGRYPPDPDPDAEYDPDEVPGSVPGDLREHILDVIERLLPAIADAPVVEEWVGVRSHTPDGHPIAGPIASGLSIAAFDSSGIQLAPAVGRAIARRIAGLEDELAGDLSIRRFD